MKIRHVLFATVLGGLALACSGGESTPEPPSEKADAKALCAAFLSEDAGDDDASIDASVAGATVTTEWGKKMQTDLQAGDGPSTEVQKAFVDKIKETKASEESLDCSLIESFWGLEL
ncbi:MAG: hypothetical protein VX899_09880 [Myxococcota bacterium]|nr:hypothetical protein [Myxococcota bacterium]